MVMSNTGKEEFIINPDGGFKHFGNVNGDFIIVKGSVPGTYRRLIKLRKQIRKEPKKIIKPNVGSLKWIKYQRGNMSMKENDR